MKVRRMMLGWASAVALASFGLTAGNATSMADPSDPVVLKGHTDKVNAVTWFTDGGGTNEKLVASAGQDKTVRVWDPDTGKEVALLRHKEAVLSVASLPHTSYLATATGTERTFRIWTDITGKPVDRAVRMRQGAVRLVAWCPDEKTIAASDGFDVQVGEPWVDRRDNQDAIVEIPDTGIGFRASLFQHNSRPGTTQTCSLAWRPDGKVVASGAGDGKVRLGEPATGGHAVLEGHTGTVHSVAWWPPDGKALASGGADGTIRLWDPAAAKRAFNVNWGPYGHPDPPAGKAYAVLKQPAAVLCVAWSPDGKTLATAGADGIIRLWNPPADKPTATLRGHVGRVNAVAWRPDGKALASAGDDKTVRVWTIN